jgi:hypothetical protein
LLGIVALPLVFFPFALDPVAHPVGVWLFAVLRGPAKLLTLAVRVCREPSRQPFGIAVVFENVVGRALVLADRLGAPEYRPDERRKASLEGGLVPMRVRDPGRDLGGGARARHRGIYRGGEPLNLLLFRRVGKRLGGRERNTANRQGFRGFRLRDFRGGRSGFCFVTYLTFNSR